MPEPTTIERTIGSFHLTLTVTGDAFTGSQAELKTVFAIIDHFKNNAKPGRPRKVKKAEGA